MKKRSGELTSGLWGAEEIIGLKGVQRSALAAGGVRNEVSK